MDRERAVAGDVEYAGRTGADRMQQDGDDVLIPDEDKGTVGTGNRQRPRFFEHVGDLIAHRRTEDRADAQNHLLQCRLLFAVL